MRLLFILLCLSLATPVQAHTLEEVKDALHGVELSRAILNATREYEALTSETERAERVREHELQHMLLAHQLWMVRSITACMDIFQMVVAINWKLDILNSQGKAALIPDKTHKFRDDAYAALKNGCDFTRPPR